ncbi:DUF5131 family protein [candidate division WOR-3 bacterium]|nr:DUF5131 family protein [candidate division WOR-3 bacterium]
MNKIGWCDFTFNPVWGCRNHCEYCYARIFANRFYKGTAEKEHRYIHKYRINSYIEWKVLENRLKNFKLTFLHSHFDKKFPKKPQRIFVGSMSEIYYWKDEWLEKVLEKVKRYPQHTFQFLTKFPEVYCKVYDFPKNCWLGVTITKDDDFDNGTYDFLRSDLNRDNIKYISFEPLFGRILSYKLIKYFDWVIIGAETGNRKDKVIPKLDWVLEIIRYCEHHKIPVYIKDNLTKYYAECRGYKQFPERVKL